MSTPGIKNAWLAHISTVHLIFINTHLCAQNMSKTKEWVVDSGEMQHRHCTSLKINRTCVEEGPHHREYYLRYVKEILSLIGLLRTCGLEIPLLRTVQLEWSASAEHTIRSPLSALQDLYTRRYRTRASRIIPDPHYPSNKLFQLMRSGKRLRSHKSNMERLR